MVILGLSFSPLSNTSLNPVTLTDETQVVVHQSSNGEDVGRVDSGADDLEPDFVILLYDHVFLGRLVARRVRVRVEGHVCGDGMAGDEARQGTDLGEEAHLVDLEIWSRTLKTISANITHKLSLKKET